MRIQGTIDDGELVSIVQGEERVLEIAVKDAEGEAVDLTDAEVVVEFAMKKGSASGKLSRRNTAIDFLDSAVNPTLDTISLPGHGLVTGDEVALSNTGGALPSPLTAGDYYVIRYDGDRIQLSETLGGEAIGIDSVGGGGVHAALVEGVEITDDVGGVLEVSLDENATSYLKPGKSLTVEVQFVKDGVTRIFEIEKSLDVVAQSY